MLHQYPGLFVANSDHSPHKLYHEDCKTLVQPSELPLKKVVGGETINDVIFFYGFSVPGRRSLAVC